MLPTKPRYKDQRINDWAQTDANLADLMQPNKMKSSTRITRRKKPPNLAIVARNIFFIGLSRKNGERLEAQYGWPAASLY